MNPRLRACATAMLVLLVGAVAAAAAVVWLGLYNVAADDPHSRMVHGLLETARERSIAARVTGLELPDLGNADRIRQGAGNYDAMCVSCHLAPGLGESELSVGLYPAPPDLTRAVVVPAEAFWVIKHGIKATGMPAWGKSMADDYIWNLTAFVKALPGMSQADYRALVASSGGHSHGDAVEHAHEEAVEHSHGEAEAQSPADLPAAATAPAKPAGKTHRHADGTVETH